MGLLVTMQELGPSREEQLPSQVDRSKTHPADCSLDSKIWRGLSRDLLEVIRTFLPPSSLFRFRCVCKQWNLLDSDPGFSKLCRQTNRPTCPSILVVTRDHDNKRAQAFYYESFCKWFKLPLDFLPEDACVPLAEDRGLICMGSMEVDSNLSVCNPLTRSWRKLTNCQLPTVCKKGQKPLVNMMVKDSGAYKVVVVGDPSLTNFFSTLVKVYDSEKGGWTDYSDKLPVRNNFPSTSVIRDGVLYWCTMSPDGLYSFNLEKDSCWSHRQVQFPRLFSPFSHAHLIQSGGHIWLLGLKLGGQSFAVGMWRLAEEKGTLGCAARWVEMSWRPNGSPLVLRHWCELQGFAQQNIVCLATLESPDWVQCDILTRSWQSGVPLPDHRGARPDLTYSWSAYKPRLDICA